MPTPSPSIQLFSAAGHLPWGSVLDRIRDAGLTKVEGFHGCFDDAPGFRAMLDERGLSMPTLHMPLERIEADPDEAAQVATDLGAATMFGPFLQPDARPTDRAGWEAMGDRLAAAHEAMTTRGFFFGWHNHDFEFDDLGGGLRPMDILLDAAPGMAWEIDVAWVQRAGQDPLEWIDARGARIVAAHVKDLASAGEKTDEGGWADLGQGIVDWSACAAALQGQGVSTFVLEHDKPADLDRFIRTSVAAFGKYFKGDNT